MIHKRFNYRRKLILASICFSLFLPSLKHSKEKSAPMEAAAFQLNSLRNKKIIDPVMTIVSAK